MKKRIVMLFLCLFAFSSVFSVQASAKVGEQHGDAAIFDDSRECDLLTAARKGSTDNAVRNQQVAPVVRTPSQGASAS